MTPLIVSINIAAERWKFRHVENAGRNAGRIEMRNSAIASYALGDKALKKYLRMWSRTIKKGAHSSR